jgi:hypothetical protein
MKKISPLKLAVFAPGFVAAATLLPETGRASGAETLTHSGSVCL